MKRFVLVPLAVMFAAVLGGSMPAHGDASDLLQVFEAQSAAAPIGVISRVPAETDGGVIFAQSHVELGKSIATAATVTLGPLGDAFVTTSVPGFTNPTFITAQYPPSKVFPTQASSKTSTGAGPISLLRADTVANASPAATADAVGGAGGISGLVKVGGGSSHSESKVLPDGTVTTTATSTLTNVGLGPLASPLLSIAAMTSTATVSIPLGKPATKSVTVTMTGALIAGIPVQITQHGVNLAGSLPVPATGLAAVNAALGQLTQLGITLQVVPAVEQVTDGGASAVGSALEIGYAVPTALLGQLPTDIGTNETILLGEVTATATARPRRPLDLPPPPATPGAATFTPSVSAPSVSPPATASTSSGGGAPSVSAAPTVPSSPPPTAALFALPPRTQNAAAKEFLLDYRIFIIAAAIAAGVFVLCRKTRLVE